VPNILFDFNGWASEYYGESLSNPGHTAFVSTPEEFIQIVRVNSFYEPERIKDFSEFFFKRHFTKNLVSFIDNKILSSN
jgi:hypothetical protein